MSIREAGARAKNKARKEYLDSLFAEKRATGRGGSREAKKKRFVDKWKEIWQKSSGIVESQVFATGYQLKALWSPLGEPDSEWLGEVYDSWITREPKTSDHSEDLKVVENFATANIVTEPEKTAEPVVRTMGKEVIDREVVRLREQGLSYKTIAKVCIKSVPSVCYRLRLSRRQRQGEVQEVVRSPGRRAKLGAKHQKFISTIIKLTDGEITLKEMALSLNQNFDDLGGVSMSTVYRTLRRCMRFSKRISSTRNIRAPSAQTSQAKVAFLAQVLRSIDGGRRVYSIDESAIVLGEVNKRRWSKVGEPKVVLETSRVNLRLTLLLAISNDGRYFGKLIIGSVTGPVFANFLSELIHYNNDCKLAFIYDNASSHKVSFIQGIVAKSQTIVPLLPAYYPQGNSVEQMFGMLKHNVRKVVLDSKEQMLRLLSVILENTHAQTIIDIFNSGIKAVLSDITKIPC